MTRLVSTDTVCIVQGDADVIEPFKQAMLARGIDNTEVAMLQHQIETLERALNRRNGRE